MPMLDTNIIPKRIKTELDAALANGDVWEERSLKPTKDLLVEFLMIAQQSRCAYCRRLIKDEIGHRELDHVLPKAAAGKAVNATSNLAKYRRTTTGYSQYRFLPRNLVLTCKRCNHRKGNYDCRANRAKPAGAKYPARAASFKWIHPYLHDYNDHITIANEFVFTEVDGSNGDVVIEACNLAGIGSLEARAREHWIRQVKDPWKLALKLLLRDLPDVEIVDTVLKTFPAVSLVKVKKMVRDNRRNRFF